MVSELRKYIKHHSSAAIRNRAKSISLTLKSRTKERYVFSYQGSDDVINKNHRSEMDIFYSD